MHVSWRSEPGVTLDETYRLEASRGLTEVGERFEATDLRDESPVIVTVLHPKLFEGAHRGPNILRVQRSRAFVHENVASVRDIVLSGDSFYVVTEPAKGTALERWVLGRLPLGQGTMADLVQQIVSALECVHLIGVHGNLNPANVYVDDQGKVTLSDPWFLERASELKGGELQARQVQWTAPEQRGEGWQERQETDVFLLGALVGWLIAGRAVAPGVSLAAQEVALSEPLDALLLRATADRPEERFCDVNAFWAALEAAWASGEESDAGGSDSDLEREEEAVNAPLDDEAADENEADEAPAEVDIASEESDEVEGEHTEAIPLEEIAEMGLDPGLSSDASHVDAILVVDEEFEVDDDALEILDAEDLEEIAPIPLVTDTSLIDLSDLPPGAEVVDAIVEVGIIHRASVKDSQPAFEDRTVQVVPGPGSAKALEAARRAEELRREVSQPEQAQPEATIHGHAGPPPRVRSRAVYVAPFLALLAGAAMFWVLNQVVGESETAPVSPTPSALTATQSSTKLAGSHARETSSAGAQSAKSSEQGKEGEQDAVTSAVSSDAAAAFPGPDAVTNLGVVSDAQAGGEASEKLLSVDATAKSGSADEPSAAATPEPESFEDMLPEDWRCPSGMAKIRSRRKVTLPDGETKKRKVIWCTDRYEYPGKGSVPTTNVTLAGAKAACRAKGRRLCRRTEWRGACGGAKFPYRGDYDPSRCNTVAPGGIPRAVVAAGTKRRCKGGFGTYDMSGNVAEWTSDGTVNGGSAYKDGPSATCYRSSRRAGGSPYVGFRCCADPLPVVREPKEPAGETP